MTIREIRFIYKKYIYCEYVPGENGRRTLPEISKIRQKRRQKNWGIQSKSFPFYILFVISKS